MLRNSEHRPCFRMTGPFRNSLGRRPFVGAPCRLSSDRTGGSVISTLEEKDSYDVGGAKSDGHGGAESSCQKHPYRTGIASCSRPTTSLGMRSICQATYVRCLVTG